MLDATTSRSTGCVAERLQQHRGSQVVDAGVFGDLVHALADADQRDQVNHGVDAFERARQRRRDRECPRRSVRRRQTDIRGRCRSGPWTCGTRLSRARTGIRATVVPLLHASR